LLFVYENDNKNDANLPNVNYVKTTMMIDDAENYIKTKTFLIKTKIKRI